MIPSLGDITLEALLQHTPVAMAVTDREGRLTMFSPALEELLGRPYRHLHEDQWVEAYQLYADDGVTQMGTRDVPLARALRGEVVTDAVMVSVREDGTRVHIRVSASPLRDDDDSVIGAVALVQDVTAERTAHLTQEHLRRQLVETINHEIRTPLSKVIGHAELLQDQREEMSELQLRSVDAIAAGAADLFSLADVVSGLADLEASARVSRTWANLAALVREVVAERRASAARHGVRLSCDAPTRLGVTLDHAQVRRAVTALVDNAVAHAPRGTAVEVAVAQLDGHVRVVVRDHGPGIPEADWPRLVEPFERGNTEVTSPAARGLGLAVARTVAAAHGGELLLEPRGPGARVVLTLPRRARTRPA